jgi:uncharacterized membrane protein
VGVLDTVTLLWLEGDFNLTPTTFAVISTIVVSLVGAITFLFRWATSTATAAQERETKRLESELARERTEKQEILDTLIETLRTAHRSTDVADEAAKVLIQERRAVRKPR